MPLTVKATRHFDVPGCIHTVIWVVWWDGSSEPAAATQNKRGIGATAQNLKCQFVAFVAGLRASRWGRKSGPREQGGLERHIQCSIVCSPRPRCGKLEMLPFFFFRDRGLNISRGRIFLSWKVQRGAFTRACDGFGNRCGDGHAFDGVSARRHSWIGQQPDY